MCTHLPAGFNTYTYSGSLHSQKITGSTTQNMFDALTNSFVSYSNTTNTLKFFIGANQVFEKPQKIYIAIGLVNSKDFKKYYTTPYITGACISN